jgi:hypothetical protein
MVERCRQSVNVRVGVMSRSVEVDIQSTNALLIDGSNKHMFSTLMECRRRYRMKAMSEAELEGFVEGLQAQWASTRLLETVAQAPDIVVESPPCKPFAVETELEWCDAELERLDRVAHLVGPMTDETDPDYEPMLRTALVARAIGDPNDPDYED